MVIPGFGLVADHVEIFPDRAEIVREALDALVETDEIEIAVTLEARNLLHIGGRTLLEILRRKTSLPAGCAAFRPSEHPAVIEALEGFGAAVFFAADLAPRDAGRCSASP
jgi:hypothetical protein